VTRVLELLEASWLILFFISIVFIFLIIFRELGDQTRGVKTWKRISYGKTLPRFSLTYQHFNRKGELLTNTSQNICRSIRKDLLDFLVVSKGFSHEEIEFLVKDKELLQELLQNKRVVEFIYNPAFWLKLIQPKPTLLSKILSPFKGIFSESEVENELFIVELLSVVNNFVRAVEAS